MAHFQLNHLLSCRSVLIICGCLIQPIFAGEVIGGLSDREISKRRLATMEAQELLRKGDESYQAGRYAEAVTAYSGAHGMIPHAPLTAELLAAAKQRYVQASIEHAKNLSRTGDVAAAKEVIEKVLQPSVSPGDPTATLALANLNDPIRTNPALTAEHAANVDQVRRLLYTAEGAYNLGKFDQAKREYERVLAIDPTNTAARRGMERVAVAKSAYFKAANDETRAAMLAQVEAAWEMQVEAPVLEPGFVDPAASIDDLSFVPVANKLSQIIIPSIRLERSSIEDAIDLLRVRSVENDTVELDPTKKGVNFTLNLGGATPETAADIRSRRFDLKLDQVPLSEVLRYISEQTGTTYTTDDFSVIFVPLGATTDQMVTRTYRVPPDFLSNLNTGGEAGLASTDPFAEPDSSGGLLARRMGVQEALVQSGVNFPQGAAASLNPTSNILRVTNTPLNLDMVQQLVESIAQTEPVSVAVRVTMIRVLRTIFEELGYDWLLDEFKLSGDAGNGLFLSGGTQGNGGDLSDIPLAPGAVNRRPITAGNRSGDGAIGADSLDSLLSDTSGGSQTAFRAPGVLGVNGYVNNTTVQMLMRGLDRKKGVDLMVHPSTVTRNGQTSTIRVVREFIYPTEYEPPEIPQQVGDTQGAATPVVPGNPTAFETREIGMILEVLPVADANRQFIDLKLQPELVDLLGFVNYGSPINSPSASGDGTATQVTANAILMPVFSTQRLNTQVTLADGATLVLGGLMEQKIEKVEDKTPILGSIPIVGRLFQSKASQTTSTAIIFLVNVELLDPTGRPYRSR